MTLLRESEDSGPSSGSASPPSRFSRSPLRLFAQAVALKTALSFWMFFSQAGAAGYMFAFPGLSKATFTSGPRQRGSTLSESMQIRVGCTALRGPAWYAQAGDGMSVYSLRRPVLLRSPKPADIEAYF